jgi:hypothetical protein
MRNDKYIGKVSGRGDCLNVTCQIASIANQILQLKQIAELPTVLRVTTFDTFKVSSEQSSDFSTLLRLWRLLSTDLSTPFVVETMTSIFTETIEEKRGNVFSSTDARRIKTTKEFDFGLRFFGFSCTGTGSTGFRLSFSLSSKKI